jgi:hypothetical protein
MVSGGALGAWVRTGEIGVVEVSGLVSLAGSARVFFIRSALAVSAAEGRLLRTSLLVETFEAAGRAALAGVDPTAPSVRASLQEKKREESSLSKAERQKYLEELEANLPGHHWKSGHHGAQRRDVEHGLIQSGCRWLGLGLLGDPMALAGLRA